MSRPTLSVHFICADPTELRPLIVFDCTKHAEYLKIATLHLVLLEQAARRSVRVCG